MTGLFKQIDRVLGLYYQRCGRNDYYDVDGTGKFIIFVKKQSLDEDCIHLELSNNVEYSSFTEMDDNFPLIKHGNDKNYSCHDSIYTETKNENVTNHNYICRYTFDTCQCINRITLVLQLYDTLIAHKPEITDAASKLLSKILPVGKYSNLQLLNDFYHIKYDHQINDDTNQFKLLYQYLVKSQEISKCENNYNARNRYHATRRNVIASLMKNENNRDIYRLNLIIGVHTYFIHSFDKFQLTDDEVKYVEDKIREYNQENSLISGGYSKYVTSDNQHDLDYKILAMILKNNNIEIDTTELSTAFNKYAYDYCNLQDDLCYKILKNDDTNTLLSTILIDGLNYSSDER
eukprot:46584_1